MPLVTETLIESIYDTVVFPERWNSVLQDLCVSASATSGFLFTATGGVDTQALWARHHIADELLRDYTLHYRNRDLWTNVAAAQGLLSHCAVWRGEEIATEAELHRSAIFNDLLQHHGIGRLCAVTLADGGDLAALQPILSLYRPAGAPPFPDEAARLLHECAPHLQRAMRLRTRLWASRDEEVAWSARVIDGLPMGVVLLDAAGRATTVNRAGQAMLDAQDGLRLVQGRLQAQHASGGRRLAHVVEAALSAGRVGRTHRGKAGDLWVPRASGKPPYQLTVLPLSHEAAEGPCGNAGGGPRIRAVVYIVDPAAVAPGLGARLGGLFGLTPVEAALVADLLADLTPAEIGDRRGVAISTVRSQLRSIFAKTGTSRQSELMNLVNRCLMLPEGP